MEGFGASRGEKARAAGGEPLLPSAGAAVRVPILNGNATASPGCHGFDRTRRCSKRAQAGAGGEERETPRSGGAGARGARPGPAPPPAPGSGPPTHRCGIPAAGEAEGSRAGVTEPPSLPVRPKTPGFFRLFFALFFFFPQPRNLPVVLGIPPTPSRPAPVTSSRASELFPFLVKVAIPAGDS